MGTTRVTKRIGRKVQPRQFESLEITTEYEDTIEWKDNKQRQERLDHVTKLALFDYQRTFESVCKDLGLESKPTTIIHENKDGVVKSGTVASKQDDNKRVVDAKKSGIEDFFDAV